VAASFLGDALKCIGITSAPKLDLFLCKGPRYRPSAFDNVGRTRHSIPPRSTTCFRASIPAPSPPEDIKGGYLHIAYDYAFAGSLSMRAAGDGAASFNAKAVQIGTYIDLGAQGKVEATDETTISFASKDGTAAAFAYKIGRLENRGKNGSSFRKKNPARASSPTSTKKSPTCSSAESSCASKKRPSSCRVILTTEGRACPERSRRKESIRCSGSCHCIYLSATDLSS